MKDTIESYIKDSANVILESISCSDSIENIINIIQFLLSTKVMVKVPTRKLPA